MSGGEGGDGTAPADGGQGDTLAEIAREAGIEADDDLSAQVAALGRESAEPGAEDAQGQDADERGAHGRSGAALQDMLTAQGEGELAERVGPAMLESADAGFREFKGPDLDHVRDVADAVGATEGLVVTAARLADAVEAGTWAAPDLDPAAHEWLGDGGLTDQAKAWLRSDDPVAAGFRSKHGGGAAGERVLANAMRLAFDRNTVDPALRKAIAGAGWQDELAALNKLAQVAGQLKSRR